MKMVCAAKIKMVDGCLTAAAQRRWKIPHGNRHLLSSAADTAPAASRKAPLSLLETQDPIPENYGPVPLPREEYFNRTYGDKGLR
jgi:hypothetical protein